MPIWWTIYTSENCKYCKDAKNLLDLHGIDYHEISIEEEGVRDMFKEKGFKTVPQVFKEKTSIGGFNALENYLKEKVIAEEIKHKSKGKPGSFRSA